MSNATVTLDAEATYLPSIFTNLLSSIHKATTIPELQGILEQIESAKNNGTIQAGEAEALTLKAEVKIIDLAERALPKAIGTLCDGCSRELKILVHYRRPAEGQDGFSRYAVLHVCAGCVERFRKLILGYPNDPSIPPAVADVLRRAQIEWIEVQALAGNNE